MDERIPLSALKAVPGAFRALLERNDVSIHPQSALQVAMRDLDRFAEVMQARDAPDADERRKFISRTMTAYALGAMVLNAEASESWPTIKTKLRLLGKGEFPTAPSDRHYPGRGEAFNVITACAAARFAKNVRYSDVDVLFDFREIAWGVECKSLSPTAAPTALSEDIVDGRRQIELAAKRGQLSRGIVLVNVTDMLDHEEVFRLGSPEPLNDVIARIASGVAAEHLRRRPFDDPSFRGFAFIAWRVRSTGATEATFEYSMPFIRRADADAHDVAFTEALQTSFQF